MKVIRELNITKEDFFNVIFQNLIDGIRKDCQKTIVRKDIKKGEKFVYSNHQNSSNMALKILDLINNSYFKYKFTSDNYMAISSFQIRECKKGIMVEYELEISNYTVSKLKLFTTFSKIFYFSKMSSYLYDIQNTVWAKKEGLEKVQAKKFLSPMYYRVTKEKD